MRGHARTDAARGFGGAGEGHAGDAGACGKCRAHGFARARQKLEHFARHAGLVQKRHRARGNEGRFLGRFGEHRVARGERRGDLAGEYGERKVPGRDTGEGAARGGFVLPGFGGVIAQEIGGLAQLAHRIGERLARLARQKRMDGAEIGLIEIGGVLKHRGALFHRRLPGARGADRRLHLIGCRRVHRAHLIARIRRVRYRLGRAIGQIGGQCGARGEGAFAKGRAGLFDLVKRQRIGKIPSARILPLRLEEIGRQADRGGARGRGLECCKGIGGDRLGRHVFIDDLIDEGAVGAVFQEPAHQIGQKIAMLAHRRIDAAARALARHDDIMQPLAHAVQALEFVIPAPKPRFARHMEDRLHRMGVMGGELGIDAIRHPQKPARIGDIGNIRGRLAGKHRKARRADHLGALDLAVPVGALHEPHHDAPLKPFGERMEPFDHRARALAIGLHHHAEAIPARKRGIGEHRLDHIERKIEAVGLLGIDVEAHAGRARKRGE